MLDSSVIAYIENDLRERNIHQIFHFTNLGNLNNILNNGLKSIALLDHEETEYYYNDAKRLDERHDYISLSISFPNYKMFWKCRQEEPNEQFVVLELSPMVILSKDCLFFYTNAACSEFRYQNEHFYQTTDAWNSLFLSENRNQTLPLKYTTDVQAELMIQGIIEPEYIKKIHFSGKKNFPIPNHIDYEEYSGVFSYRKEDYN